MIPFALIVLDHNFNFLSCNSEVFKLLGMDKLENPSRRLPEFLDRQEEYRAFLHDLRMEVLPSQQATLNMTSPEGSALSIGIQVSKSSGIKETSHYYLILTPEHQKNWEKIHLNRSIRFNSINKIGPSVAHEIRNPLSTIAIQRQILENSMQSLGMDPENEGRIQKSLRILNTELDRVSRLMEHFFKLVRTGNKEPTYEDVNSILREIYELVKQYCYENGIEIHLELENNVPFVYIKRDPFIQVLLNLIINAVESISAKGTLRIVSHKGENKSIVKIVDTGGGITESQRSKIFTYYYSTKEEGGGVSLALAQQTIQEMRGNLHFTSNKGGGVSFTIEVPKADKF